MKTSLQSELLTGFGVQFERSVQSAMARAIQSTLGGFQHLPMPVAFRATGALRAWERSFEMLLPLALAKSALADPHLPVEVASSKFKNALSQYIGFSESGLRYASLLHSTCDMSADLLAFWLRHGQLYEPTLPLGHLLSGLDICENLPAQWLAPPVPAMCIVPALEQRLACSGATSILVFGPDQASAQQTKNAATVTVVAFREVKRGWRKDAITLCLDDPARGMLSALEGTIRDADHAGRLSKAISTSQDTRLLDWRHVLDYVAKVLLYLRMDDALV
jgi:hypothetical protein